MSLLLAQQTELDKPFRFQNHLSNTIEIKPNSEIALNHVTINRATFYQFEEDKILYICHTNQVPDSFPHPFYYIYPDAAEYDESSEDMNVELTKETFNPFLNYPQPIIVKAGVYSVETLSAYIQTRLNIPTVELGGDFYPSKKWTVAPNVNAAGEMDGFKFDFEQAFVGNLQDHTFSAFETSTILTPIIPEYHDAGNIPNEWVSTDKYSATADTHQLNITPTKDAQWTASGTFNYFLSTSSGVVTSSKVSDWNTSQDKFKQVPIHFGVSGITKKPAVFGISRFTDGQKFCGAVHTQGGTTGPKKIPYFDMSEMNLVLGLSEPSSGIAQQFFYDYCCVIDATDELHLFQLYVDIKSSNRPVFRMREIKYWEISNIGHSDFTAPLKINETPSTGPPVVLRYNCISIDLNNTQVTVLASEYNDSKFSNEKIVSHHQLKPLHSCNQQLVPKFNLYHSGDTLSLLLPTFSKYQRDGVSTPPYFQARSVSGKSVDNGLFDYPALF